MIRHCESKDSWRQSDVLYIPSQVKSALRKLRKGKDRECDLIMSDVSVLYKSCVAHLAEWTSGANDSGPTAKAE